MYVQHRNWRFHVSWPTPLSGWFRWGETVSGGGWIDDIQVWRVGPFCLVREFWPELRKTAQVD